MHVIEGNTEGRMEAVGRQGIRHNKLLDDLREMQGYWSLKEEALDRTL